MHDVREIFRSILDSALSEVVEVTPYGIIYRGKQQLDEAKVFREFQEKIGEGIEELEDIVKDTGVGIISNYDDIDTTIKDLGGDTRVLLGFGWYADITSISLIDLGGPRTYVYLFTCDGHPCFIAALSGPVTSNLLSRFITHLFRENGDDFHVFLGACLPPEGITNDCPDLIDQDNLKQAIWNLFRRHIWMTYDEHDDLPPVEQLAYFETYFKEAYRTNILRSALADKGDKDGYITELRAELRYKPDDAETHRELGHALLRTGDQDGAITEYRTVLRLQPDDARAHTNIGNALFHKSDWDGAITEYRIALRLQRDDADAHNGLGLALAFGKDDWNAAITEHRAALCLKPDHANAHYNLGIALAHTGDLVGAIVELRAALHLKPEDAETHRKLGLALAHTGDQDGAITEYRTSLRLQPDHTSTHYNLGNVLKANGQKREAAQEFREYLRLAPDADDRQVVEQMLRDLERP